MAYGGVGRVNRDGTSMLLTTHRIEKADQLCDRVAIVDYVYGVPITVAKMAAALCSRDSDRRA